MRLISTYQDLLIEIDIYESRLEDLQREDYALRRIEYNRIDLETYVNRKHKLNNEAAIIQAILEDKKETQREPSSDGTIYGYMGYIKLYVGPSHISIMGKDRWVWDLSVYVFKKPY